MIVDGNDRILILFNQCAHKVIGAFLHLGVGTLNGIQFDAVAVATGIDRRNGTSTQANAVVIATDNDYLVALLRFFLQADSAGAAS